MTQSMVELEMIDPDLGTSKIRQVPKGTPLLDLLTADEIRGSNAVLAAMADNDLVNLHTGVHEPAQVRWVRRNSASGFRIYQQSLLMLLKRGAARLFPEQELQTNHTLDGHYFCEFLSHMELSDRRLAMLAALMRDWVQQDIEIGCRVYPKAEAFQKLSQMGRMDTIVMLEQTEQDTVALYELEEYMYYSGIELASNTGALDLFDLTPHDTGFLMRMPSAESPEILADAPQVRKLSAVFRESQRWARIMGVQDIAGLNRVVDQGPEAVTELIHINEALQEKNIARVADDIYNQLDRGRLILIAGPSSSGKTTFTQRLAIQLRVLGLRPVSISLDDYFLDYEKTPLDSLGEKDFESVDALDLALFNEHLNLLIDGREAVIPIYDFQRGKRHEQGKALRLETRHPVIVEGIHALNDRLTFSIDRSRKYKIYISALAQMSLDANNRVFTTDARLIRRIVRDYRYRSKKALETLRMWASVRRGEQTNIFPHQEDADMMFNSALLYELGILKPFAEPLLREISRNEPYWADAQRLCRLLSYFPALPHYHVPLNSILREFIGGSAIYGERA